MSRPSFILSSLVKRELDVSQIIKAPLSRTLLAIVILMLASSCSKPLYVALDSNAYPPNTKPLKKYILLDNSHFEQPVDVATLAKALNNGSFKSKAASFKLMKDELAFLRAVDLIQSGEYETAQNMLYLLPEGKFDWQVKLLKIDCARHLGLTLDARKEYQVAYDSAASAAVKDLAKVRYRFYQYGK